MPEKKKGSKKKQASPELQSDAAAPAQRSTVRFLPCPGLTNEELVAARQEHAAFFEQQGKRPKEKIRYTFEDKQKVDFVREVMAKNVWYYKDRMMVSRGPCNLHVLRDCWVHGVIDESTLVWGQGLADWLPIRNVRTLVPQIRTLEVQAATWLKKTFGLKPAINRMRKQRAAERAEHTTQVDRMF